MAWLPFLVAFTVVASGITSASTSSNLLAANLLAGLDETVGGAPTSEGAVLAAALGFMVLLAVINLRGVGESVKFNVVLTLVAITALGIVTAIGFWAMASQGADVGQVVTFDSVSDRGTVAAVTVATAIAFFSMVGFEDSVNMVEETKDPERIFPRVMFTGLGLAVVIYMLVAVSVVMVLPLGKIQGFAAETGILLEVVRTGAPGFPVDTVFPFLSVFAVANTALINMPMASRLVYGMAKQDVLPRSLGHVLTVRRTPWSAIAFTTALALGLITVVTYQSDSSIVGALGGTTGLLLLIVFTIVNVACLVLRRDHRTEPRLRAPTWIPVVGAAGCAFLVGPWARDPEDWIQYEIGAGLLAVGVGLWLLTWLTNRGVRAKRTGFREPEHIDR